jgi:nitroreductase
MPRRKPLSELVSKPAQTNANLDQLIRDRWSPRIYDPKHELFQADLEALGEAFRWAPSSSNQQPWKLVMVSRGTDLHAKISEQGLGGFNASWAPNASALAIVLGEIRNAKGEERNRIDTAFDLGLATMKLTIQAESMGLKAHVMGGIDHEAIKNILSADDHFVMVAIAIGHQGSVDGQEQTIVAREKAPRERKSDAYLINPSL